jgi:hypothetical protein
MATALQAETAQKQIQAAAEQACPDTRVIRTIEVGQAIRQGDIYVTRVADKRIAHGGETAERQLAPGTSRGSRHCVAGAVSVYRPVPGDGQLAGPLIVALERFKVTHPEHAHFSLPPGTYRVTYQRDFNREREVVRVSD